MRNALLATIILGLFGAIAGTAALLPEILGKNAGLPLAEQRDFPRPAETHAVAPQKTTGSNGFSEGSGAVATHTAVPAQEWAEKMFTAGVTKDFGVVYFGTQLFHGFEITNVYAAPVEITGVRTSCCCVTATPGKRILQPGESTTIDVCFDTRQFTGPNAQTIRVVVGPNPRSACVLKVSAVSQTDVAFEADRVSFGTVACGQASVQSMDVEYHGTLAWTIDEVIVAKELPFQATLSELVCRPGSVRYRIAVTLKEDARPGEIRDYIYLRTNQVGVPPVPLLVTASVQAPPGEGRF